MLKPRKTTPCLFCRIVFQRIVRVHISSHFRYKYLPSGVQVIHTTLYFETFLALLKFTWHVNM